MVTASELRKQQLKDLAGLRVNLTQPNLVVTTVEVKKVGFPRRRTSERIAVLTEAGTGEQVWVASDSDITVQ